MNLDEPDGLPPVDPAPANPAAPRGTRARPASAAPKKSYGDLIREKKLAKGEEAAAVRPYRHLLPINEKSFIGHWWAKHESIYPYHAAAARRYTCIPATSAPCERVFSTGGRVLDKRRAALKPDTVHDIIIVHDNIDKLDRITFQDSAMDDD